MAYAADRLYNEVIRKMMATLATDVKVREIITHLPCLTISDREEIEAKRETCGNYNAMTVLLDNMRRRESWPDQFIAALKKCEQQTLANLISDAYDNIRGIHTPPAPVPAAASPNLPSFPAEPSATVTTATIHKIPCSTPSFQTPSVETPAKSSTLSSMNASASVSAPTLTPSVGQSEIVVDAGETATLGISDGLTDAALSGLSLSPEINNHVTTSQSSALTEKVPVSNSPSVKNPVQDTTPVLARDSQTNTAINQVVERVHTSFSPNHQTQETSQRPQASTSTSADVADRCLSNFPGENEEILSKPGVLREQEPHSFDSDPSLQISQLTAENSPMQPARPQTGGEEPVSVTNDLTTSSATTVSSQFVSDHVGHVQYSPRAFENGFPEGENGSYPHQPVEDHYDSLQTRRHVIQISEDSSLQNLSQPMNMVEQTTAGLGHNRGAESLVSKSSQATFHDSELNDMNQTNTPQSELRESHGVLHQFQSNSHLIAAAAFSVAAVFVALKLKH